jgi:hypothetical protein
MDESASVKIVTNMVEIKNDSNITNATTYHTTSLPPSTEYTMMTVAMIVGSTTHRTIEEQKKKF